MGLPGRAARARSAVTASSCPMSAVSSSGAPDPAAVPRPAADGLSDAAPRRAMRAAIGFSVARRGWVSRIRSKVNPPICTT